MINNSALFLAKCKETLNKMDEGSIQKIRDDLEKVKA